MPFFKGKVIIQYVTNYVNKKTIMEEKRINARG